MCRPHEASVTVRTGVPIAVPRAPGGTGIPDAALDLYLPALAPDGGLPLVLWVHGGGYVMGSAAMVADVATALAGGGYALAVLEYTLAPAATYPTPVRQAGAALTYLQENAGALGIDAGRVVLAGDSAGAQIASQVASIETSPAAATAVGLAPVLAPGALRGAMLCCGMFDMATVRETGFRGIDTMVDAYLGSRQWPSSPALDQLSTTRHVTPAFPSTFLSAGDTDPFLPQTLELAGALRRAGVRVETDLPSGGLGHEYQLNLRLPQARTTLARMVAFLHGCTSA